MFIVIAFHKSVLLTKELLNKGASPDPNCSRDLAEALGKKTEEDDMDDAIDKAFEAVIREDIEASAKKQRKSEGW